MKAIVAFALGVSLASGAWAFAPEVEYQVHCQGCHRVDGAGTDSAGVPALKESVARFLHVPGGREFLVRVPGVSQAPIDDATLASVLEWMLRRFDAAHVPADHRPYTAEEVGKLRRDPLVDVDKVRKGLVERFATAP